MSGGRSVEVRLARLEAAVNMLDREAEFNEDYLRWVDEQLRDLRYVGAILLRCLFSEKQLDPKGLLGWYLKKLTSPNGPQAVPPTWIERYLPPHARRRHRLYASRPALLASLRSVGAKNVSGQPVSMLLDELRSRGITPERRDLL